MQWFFLAAAACLSASVAEVLKEAGFRSGDPEFRSPSGPNAVVSNESQSAGARSPQRDDPEQDRPRNLVVVGATPHSISLKWDLNPASGSIDGYRIYYHHENFSDVKTVLKANSSYDLHGLGKQIKAKVSFIAALKKSGMVAV